MPALYPSSASYNRIAPATIRKSAEAPYTAEHDARRKAREVAHGLRGHYGRNSRAERPC